MGAARTARRRRRQLAQNNSHLSGLRVSRYPGNARAAEARANRLRSLNGKKR